MNIMYDRKRNTIVTFKYFYVLFLPPNHPFYCTCHMGAERNMLDVHFKSNLSDECIKLL